jgi:hypothetical protein
MSEVEVASPDVSILKTCVFDVEFAQQLVDNPSITKDERDKLRRILKEKKQGNQLETHYKLGKNCKHEFLGRWCAIRGFGLQSLQHDIRAALSAKHYIDVDIVNAQPTLLVQYCEQRGWMCDSLKKYVSEREELLADMCDQMAINRWEAKQKVVSILFGANASGMPTFFQDELYPEIRKITTNIFNEHEASLKWLKKHPNYMGKGLSYILQTEERKCLESLDKSLAKRGRSLDVLIHDGGLVRKKGDETTLPDAFLRELEKDIKKDTGYSIKLAVKPLETTFEFGKHKDDVYTEMKREFEQEYMKLMSPALYVRIHKGSIDTINQATLVHQKQNLLLPDGSSFIGRWIKDPNIRTYECLTFAPKQEVAEDEFNLFTKFEIDPEPVQDISIILALLSLVCNHEVKVVEYFLNYLAHIIQKPWVKTGIAIVIQGNQGSGKETFVDHVIGKILGKKYYFSTSTPEHDVFHQFNSGTERALIVKFEEADFKTNKQNASKLKAIITKRREKYIQKGQDGIILDDYRNFIMTTNDEVPVVLENAERRFLLVKTSDEKIGDVDYWKDTYKALDNPHLLAQFHQFLLDRDISNFDCFRDRVITQYYKDTKQAFAPYHARFLCDELSKREVMTEEMELQETTTIEWKAYHLYSQMKEAVASKFELSLKQFGTHMKMYVDNGCITKRDSSTGVKYTLYPELFKQFMKSKDWYIEV